MRGRASKHASWLLVGLLLTLGAGRALAGEESPGRAKALFLDGRKEFLLQHYELAYHLFERSYQASSHPALLFDMATCLSRLDRPREAATKLREFLDRVPNEPQRAGIEDTIRELKERAVEQDEAAHAERNVSESAAPAVAAYDPQRAALEDRIRALEARLGSEPPTAPPPSRRRLAIGLGVTAGVIVLAGVALTVGLVLNRGENFTPSSFGGGPLQSTR